MLIVVTAGPCPNYLSFDAPHCYSWPSWSASPTWFLCKCGHIPTPQTRGQSGGSCHGWRLKHVAICSGKHGRLKLLESNQPVGPKLRCPPCSSWVQGDYVLVDSLRSAIGFKLHFYIHVLCSFSFKSDAAIALFLKQKGRETEFCANMFWSKHSASPVFSNHAKSIYFFAFMAQNYYDILGITRDATAEDRSSISCRCLQSNWWKQKCFATS